MNNKPCACGNPKLQGVMHTNYGPCYLYEIGQIDGAVDGEGRLIKLEMLKSYDVPAAQLRERLAEAERELALVADFVEPHWRGAGAPLKANWIIKEIKSIVSDLDSANDDLDTARAEVDKLKNKITFLQADIEYLSDDRSKHRSEAEGREG